MAKKRCNFPRSIQKLVWSKQNGNCPECKRPLIPSHTNNHHRDGDHSNCKTSNLKIVCNNCHGDITNKMKAKEEEKKIRERQKKHSYAGVWAVIIIILIGIGIWYFVANPPQLANEQTAPKEDVWSKTSNYTLDDCYEVCKSWGANVTDGVSYCNGQCKIYSKYTIDYVTFEDWVNKIKSEVKKK